MDAPCDQYLLKALYLKINENNNNNNFFKT